MAGPRQPLTVQFEERDCWAIQASLKFPFVMLSPVNQRPIFPPETVPTLRAKVNHALLRFANEKMHGLSSVDVPLSYAECWVIDWALNANSYDGAQRFLVQVFECMAEHEMHGMHLRSNPDLGDIQWTKEHETLFAEWITTQTGEQSANDEESI